MAVVVTIGCCHGETFQTGQHLVNHWELIKMRVFLILNLAIAVCQGGYQRCLVKNGECLDGNRGPLIENVKPHVNQNVINATAATSLEDCGRICFEDENCGYVLCAAFSSVVD